MRKIEKTVYKFHELSDEAKEKALLNLQHINVELEWWDYTYDDAENIGLKINGFDIGRPSYVDGEFLLSANEVAQNIFNDHGDKCETYKTAENFMAEWEPVFSDYMNEDSEHFESYESEQKLEEIESEFLKSLCEDYRIMLMNEYDYLTEEEAIIDTIEANEYEFYENGKLL